MAKFTVIAAAAALLCLFTLSFAATEPENDDVATTLSIPIYSHSFRLPAHIETEPDSSAAANTESEHGSAVPLTEVTFHPVNHRFRPRSKFPCHHHHHRSRVNPNTEKRVEIPFGDDMLVASGENSDFANPEISAVKPKFFANGHRVKDTGSDSDSDSDSNSDSDSDSDSDDEDEDKIKRIDRAESLRKLKKLNEHVRIHKGEKREAGFMKRVRHFLHHLF